MRRRGHRRVGAGQISIAILAAFGLLAGVFALGTFFWISLNQSYMSDDFSLLERGVDRSLWEYLVFWYESWIGRLAPISMGYLVLPYPWLFAFVNTGALAGLVGTTFRLGLGRWPRLDLKDGALLLVIFATFWFGSPAQEQVLMWRVGAFTYSWALLLGLAFAIPYRKWFSAPGETRPSVSIWKTMVMFLAGVATGMSHEQVAVGLGWVGVWLLVFAIRGRLVRTIPPHLYAGAVGLVAGLTALVMAPGNAVRISREPEWAADKAEVFWRFMSQAFERDWAAGYMWIALLLVLGMGVAHARSRASETEGCERGSFFPALAFVSAGVIMIVPLYRYAWATGPRATFFSFAFVVIGILTLIGTRERPVLEMLTVGSLVALTVFVGVLLVADACYEIDRTAQMESEVRARTRTIVKVSRWAEDIVVSPIEVEPRRFQHLVELHTDPDYWVNSETAKYYGLSSLVLKRED